LTGPGISSDIDKMLKKGKNVIAVVAKSTETRWHPSRRHAGVATPAAVASAGVHR
jgi:hypothetical protein